MSEFNFDEFKATEKAAIDKALASKREFAFTSVKEFRGREGLGYSGNVTRNGKVVGEVIDEGNGGAAFLRLSGEDHVAFIAEGQSFYGETEHNVEEGYASMLALAAAIARKRHFCVSTDQYSLYDGEFITISGSSKDAASVAAYVLSGGSGIADQNPLVWVKAENRFVPATDLTA